MKTSVTQENLARALGVVGRIAGARTSLPILANILLGATGGQLKLSATNLEVGITQSISAKIDEPGSITIPARLLHDYVTSLPPQNITLATKEHKLSLDAGRYTSTINGTVADEFPSIPDVQGKNKIILPSNILKQSLQKVIFAASQDDTRPVLTAVMLCMRDQSLYMVATDSYRLSEQKVDISEKNDDLSKNQLLIPARSLNELLRILYDDQDVELSWDEAQAEVNIDNTTLVTRLIDGTYPKYSDLIPNASDTTITIDREEFLSITKVASLFARESAGGITLSANQNDHTLSVRSVASQVGENTSTAEAEVVGGDGEVTLNSRYLMDALNAIDSKKVTFRFTGKVSPCVIEPVGLKGQLHVVMPLRS